MTNNRGLLPFNGHRIQSRSSESFIDAHEVISRLNLKGNETFLDAGCGDGHVAMGAYNMLNKNATIYALDVYKPSIEDLEKEIKEKNISNIIPIHSDISSNIALSNDTIDFTLMINVFHGFVAQDNVDESIMELKRVTKPKGKIAVMDYKKIESKYGPPTYVRKNQKELEELFHKHNLKLVNQDNDIGELYEDGTKSHYLMIFEK
jgi:ubiquinone/menaquinone biosynthesis C-methylase UbiE